MKQIVLDFRTAQTPSHIHRILAQELDFPPYYGANLDALWDCLSEWQGGADCENQGEIAVLRCGNTYRAVFHSPDKLHKCRRNICSLHLIR